MLLYSLEYINTNYLYTQTNQKGSTYSSEERVTVATKVKCMVGVWLEVHWA